ncbi:hypothetical protein [Halobacillus litoralis]|uniref:Uncharacterized protein n=1 Tax=Halobacillus litoralis TaxID=45668 RepID=A0A410MJD5_9BACI|nr:hypothetical protein [Halobacillus litoralis]QAS54813.1 hypothetical protein HLI_21405 [Halobacillus litoralis]
MPKSVPGKLSLLVLVVFLIQIVSFTVALSTNFLGAMLQFITFTPFTASFGLIIGIISFKKETSNKIVPIVTITISAIFILIMLIFLFGFSFGG